MEIQEFTEHAKEALERKLGNKDDIIFEVFQAPYSKNYLTVVITVDTQEELQMTLKLTKDDNSGCDMSMIDISYGCSVYDISYITYMLVDVVSELTKQVRGGK